VTKSLQSVLDQTYKNYELIVVDDGSTDDSQAVISKFVKHHPHIIFIPQQYNGGICKAFNTAYKISTGNFIVDLAADDTLLPDRLLRGITSFNKLNDEYGVIFSDADWVDADGKHLYRHSEKFPHDTVPQGNVYVALIERYFICSPTMMFRRSVMEKLGGYDESLTYEDFDFWIRSSRHFKYYYDPDVLVEKRKLKDSLSGKQFKIWNIHNASTYRVCVKVLDLNKTIEENNALRRRILYEIRQCVKTLDFRLALKYVLLLNKVRGSRFKV
jgi:glycosyltransferase involved in cell wall biosynthesis